jgi:membrane-associated phospholipid phosphatase
MHLTLHPSSALALALVLFSGLCNSPQCAAQAVEPRAALQDAKLYFTAPIRWEQDDWLRFGGTLVVLGVAYNYDENVRSHFTGGSDEGFDDSDSNSTSDALPAAVLVAGTWMYAALIDSPAGYQELGSMLEAGVLSAASTEILKLSLGRERPYDTADANSWFESGDSFPSLHSSAAFSIGTVFAESGNDDYRWLRRVVGYGVAGYTGYNRVSDNAHWMSDVMAGAALGYYTAHFVMNRRTVDGAERTEPSVMLLPMDEGLMLTFSMAMK